MNGKLYGIGVGPGAADLLTLRAVAVLGRVDVVLAAASPRNDYSTALQTALPHMREDVTILRLEFPMTHDRKQLQEAWATAATKTEEVLRQGNNAAFLTIGDPLVYSTFGYLMHTLKETAPDLEVEVVPGITSFQAAAARTRTVLCEAHENLLILPGINTAAALQEGLNYADNTVILKAYKNFPVIREAVRSTGGMDKAVFVSRVCLEGESICHNLEDLPDVPPYLSLVMTRK